MWIYSFPLSAFPNGQVAHDRLLSDISASAISVAVDRAESGVDAVSVTFKAELGGTDQATLSAIVAAHSGDPLGNPVTVDGVPLVSISGAKEDDQKLVVVSSPAREGWMTMFTGAADDPAPTPPASGRCSGQKIRLSFAGPGEQILEIPFGEPIEMHDGGFWTSGAWGMNDEFDLSVAIPATPLTANPGAGNCNLVDIPGTGGLAHLIVPAAGDGSHDVVLSAAAPIPALDEDGFWDVDYETGVPKLAQHPGAARWNLMDVPTESFFLRRYPFGHPLHVYDFDVYKAEWVPPKWTIRIKITKVSAGAGEFAGWLMLFRKYST